MSIEWSDVPEVDRQVFYRVLKKQLGMTDPPTGTVRMISAALNTLTAAAGDGRFWTRTQVQDALSKREAGRG